MPIIKKKTETKGQCDMLLSRPCTIADETWLYNRVIGDFVGTTADLPTMFYYQTVFSPAENLLGIAPKWLN